MIYYLLIIQNYFFILINIWIYTKRYLPIFFPALFPPVDVYIRDMLWPQIAKFQIIKSPPPQFLATTSLLVVLQVILVYLLRYIYVFAYLRKVHSDIPQTVFHCHIMYSTWFWSSDWTYYLSFFPKIWILLDLFRA